MGNIFNINKVKKINNDDLYTSLLGCNLNEKIIKLEEKIYVLETNTQTNLKIISADVHLLYEKINYLP